MWLLVILCPPASLLSPGPAARVPAGLPTGKALLTMSAHVAMEPLNTCKLMFFN